MPGYIELSPILRSSEDGKRIYWKCPACRTIHGVVVEGAGRWIYNNDPHAPSFEPSILVAEVVGHWPRCHSFIRRGVITFCTDCSHHVVGDVAIPPWDSIP